MSVSRSGSNRAPIDWDKNAACAIARSVWSFVVPGDIVADPGRTLWGVLNYSTAELVDG